MPSLEVLTGAFENCELRLDGKWLRDATLANVTLIYNGGEVQVSNIRFTRPCRFNSDAPNHPNVRDLRERLGETGAFGFQVHIQDSNIRGFPNLINAGNTPVDVTIENSIIDGGPPRDGGK